MLGRKRYCNSTMSQCHNVTESHRCNVTMLHCYSPAVKLCERYGLRHLTATTTLNTHPPPPPCHSHTQRPRTSRFCAKLLPGTFWQSIRLSNNCIFPNLGYLMGHKHSKFDEFSLGFSVSCEYPYPHPSLPPHIQISYVIFK